MLRTLVFFSTAAIAAAQRFDYEEEPHHYWSAPLTDSCTALDRKLADGKCTLDLNGGREFIRDVLRQLNIPEASQVLVFSKTSLQKDRIRPSQPRAIYFNDECYAGWVPGGMVELAGIDPQLGPVFYSLDPRRTDRAVPRLDRSESCMNCHGGSITNSVPGLFVRSVNTDSDGSVLHQAGTSLIDHASPFDSRWGGWYVTGRHGHGRHMGNVTAESKEGNIIIDSARGANVTSLEKFIPVNDYPRPDSDIVALMVLEHQAGMHSRLIEAAYDVRMALHRQKALQEELGEPVTSELTGSAKVVTDSHAEKVLRYLLFCGEAALPEGGIDGGADFTAAFRATRRASPSGKSLRDFQLLNRLFKYRCSYLIYSRVWDGLPGEFRALLYQKLHAILTARKPVTGYEHLGADERRDILDILLATKDGLPPSWREHARSEQ